MSRGRLPPRRRARSDALSAYNSLPIRQRTVKPVDKRFCVELYGVFPGVLTHHAKVRGLMAGRRIRETVFCQVFLRFRYWLGTHRSHPSTQKFCKPAPGEAPLHTSLEIPASILFYPVCYRYSMRATIRHCCRSRVLYDVP